MERDRPKGGIMKFLVAIDLSEPTRKIVETLKTCTDPNRDEVWLLHVAQPEPEFVGFDVDTPQMREVLAKRFHTQMCALERFEEELVALGVRCTAQMLQGDIIETILHKAKQEQVDMIMIGSHGHRFLSRMLLGSVSEAVVRRSEIPVIIVPTHQSA